MVQHNQALAQVLSPQRPVDSDEQQVPKMLHARLNQIQHAQQPGANDVPKPALSQPCVVCLYAGFSSAARKLPHISITGHQEHDV